MIVVKLLLASAILVVSLEEIYGHGMVMDPVNRSSAWKKDFNTPVNYDDNGLYCGGIGAQHVKNKGKCGICGDDYALKSPRPNENGGKYGTGTIVRTYRSGERIKVQIELNKNHGGYFKFALCPLSHPKQLETEECFDAHPLKLADGLDIYNVTANEPTNVYVELILPKGLTCNHCVFRWHWTCGNNWGDCGNGTEDVGCGPQETWRTCSDIKIE